MDLKVLVSSAEHVHYAETVCQLIAESAKARGTGIAARKPEYIRAKMEAGNGGIRWGYSCGILLCGSLESQSLCGEFRTRGSS